MWEAPDIPGAADVVAVFGYWPNFHDAEVLSITLDRSLGCRIAIQAFLITPDAGTSGSFVISGRPIVTFFLEGFPQDQVGLPQIRVECFNHQNVLNGASVKKIAEGYELVLEGIYGVDGSIVGERISVKVEDGGVPIGL